MAGVRFTLFRALWLIPSKELRVRLYREGVTAESKRPSIPLELGERPSDPSPEGEGEESAGRFLPALVDGGAALIGRDVAAAAVVVMGVREEAGGRPCSGVWKVDPPAGEAKLSSMMNGWRLCFCVRCSLGRNELGKSLEGAWTDG